MTVKELIERLETFGMDTPVSVYNFVRGMECGLGEPTIKYDSQLGEVVIEAA